MLFYIRNTAFKQLTCMAENCFCITQMWLFHKLQWDLSIMDSPNKGHLSYENSVCPPNHIQPAVYRSTS